MSNNQLDFTQINFGLYSKSDLKISKIVSDKLTKNYFAFINQHNRERKFTYKQLRDQIEKGNVEVAELLLNMGGFSIYYPGEPIMINGDGTPTMSIQAESFQVSKHPTLNQQTEYELFGTANSEGSDAYRALGVKSIRPGTTAAIHVGVNYVKENSLKKLFTQRANFTADLYGMESLDLLKESKKIVGPQFH